MAQPRDFEAKWRAEDDARILQTAAEIRKDPKRLKAAVDAAKRLATEAREKAEAMDAVAKRSGLLKMMPGEKK